jgi:hypothetical protein
VPQEPLGQRLFEDGLVVVEQGAQQLLVRVQGAGRIELFAAIRH